MEPSDLRQPGIRKISIALEPDMEFEKLVSVLKDVLTLPEIPRGCAPCLSGLDRIVIDSTVFERVQQQRRQLG